MSATNNTTYDILDVSDERTSALVDSLKPHPNWVGFTDDKVPIDPETGSAASINDTDTWSGYQQAAEYCMDTGDYLGYALDGSGVVFIDLDGCRDPDSGVVEDWAVDIIERVDSYTELSKSGTGYHILVHGGVEDLHSKKQKMESELVDVEKTSEIEVYEDARFAIFTFDHVAGTPKDVTEFDGLDALYTEYFGEAPDPDEVKNFDEVEVSMSAEQILEKAMQSDDKFRRLWIGDTSMHSDDHSAADLALASKLAFWTACDRDMMDSLFRKSDLMRSKWDESRGNQTYGEMTIEKAIQGTTEVYTPPSVPDDVNLVEKNGSYGHLSTDEDGEPTFNEVTNFTLHRKEILREDGEQYVKLEVRPSYGDSFEETVKPEVFNDAREFKNAICKRLSTSFSGSSHDLPELRKIVLRQDSPERVSTPMIGLHGDEFVAPTETFTEADDYTHVYRDTGSSVADKFHIKDLEYDEEEARRTLELLPQIRDSERWIPVLGYYYAALYAPMIREMEGELPAVSVTGETGAGKSSSMRVVSRSFGSDGTSFGVDSTKFSLIKHLSAVNNVPVWYDEYKPADIRDHELERFNKLLRETTNGGTATRGNPDGSETSYRLVAPVAITGEQQIQGSAERRRAILTQFKRATTDRATPTFEAFAEIEQLDLDNHAKLAFEQLLQRVSSGEDFEAIWEQCKEHARDIAAEDVGGLAVNALAMVKLGMVFYQLLCDRVNATSGVTSDEIDDALRYVAAQKGTQNRKTHLDEFMEQAVACIDNGRLNSVASATSNGKAHYTFVNLGEENEELCLKFGRVYPEISQYLRDYNLNIDLLDEESYRDRFADVVADEDSYVNNTSKQTGALNRTIALDTAALEEQLSVELDDARNSQ